MFCKLSQWVVSGLGFWTATTWAIQAANFNVTEEVAAKYNCTGVCYTNFMEGLIQDQEDFLDFDQEFYATASNFSSSKPGDLLKFRVFNATNLTGPWTGTRLYQLQYTSVDLQGTNVPVTGLIAVPYAGRYNGQEFPVIAVAHGTSGVFPGCAPSASTDLEDYDQLWSHLTARGYAVVATDYAGLGNGYIQHQYLASPAQANDLYYSVAAAHKALPSNLKREWMSLGHSEGGGAVWALAESHLVQEDPSRIGRYLGTAALAPATRIRDLAFSVGAQGLSATESSSEDELGEFPWVVFGLRSIIPGYNESWLQPIYRQRLALAELAQACFNGILAIGADLTIEQSIDISNPSFYDVLNVLENLTARGDSKSYQPILIPQGLADESVSPNVTIESFRAACSTGNDVRLQLYPEVQHSEVVGAAAPYYLQWIDDRFSHYKTSGHCSNETIQPFDPSAIWVPVNDD